MSHRRAGKWLALISLAACAPAATSPAAPAPEPRVDLAARGPLLWRVDGRDGPSYLFGTIHAGFEAEHELAPRVWTALEASGELVMEADLASIDPFEMVRLGTLPDDQSLPGLLGEADWQALRALIGSGPLALERLAPWLVYSLVLDRLYHTAKPLDLALEERAVARGMRLTYLEDWRFQARLLAGALDADDLGELLDPASHARTSLAALIAAYRDGDFGTITKLVLDPEEIREDPAKFHRLLDDRNRAWLATLVPRIERGGVFVAVGVGHLAGPEGLLALLERRGVRPRRTLK